MHIHTSPPPHSFSRAHSGKPPAKEPPRRLPPSFSRPSSRGRSSAAAPSRGPPRSTYRRPARSCGAVRGVPWSIAIEDGESPASPARQRRDRQRARDEARGHGRRRLFRRPAPSTPAPAAAWAASRIVGRCARACIARRRVRLRRRPAPAKQADARAQPDTSTSSRVHALAPAEISRWYAPRAVWPQQARDLTVARVRACLNAH